MNLFCYFSSIWHIFLLLHKYSGKYASHTNWQTYVENVPGMLLSIITLYSVTVVEKVPHFNYSRQSRKKESHGWGGGGPIIRSFEWPLTYSGSTTGSLEAAYTQATGKPVSLSEQQLVDCATAYNNFGCSGGLPSQAFEYIKYNGGLDTEEAYPYTGVNGICHYKPENVGVKVLDSVNITLVRNPVVKFDGSI